MRPPDWEDVEKESRRQGAMAPDAQTFEFVSFYHPKLRDVGVLLSFLLHFADAPEWLVDKRKSLDEVFSEIPRNTSTPLLWRVDEFCCEPKRDGRHELEGQRDSFFQWALFISESECLQHFSNCSTHS